MVSSSSSVSLVLCSHSRVLGSALRFLSRVAVEGEVSFGACSYGSGALYVSFVPVPEVAAVWVAVKSLAFVDDHDGVSLAFAADWSVGGDNSRAAALEALLTAINA